MLQATVAILLLVGFESVTSLGEEAKNPTKDIPRGVLLSLTIQGLFCYLIRIFRRQLFHEQRLQPGRGEGLRGSDRRHDGDGWQRADGRAWAGVHAGRSLTVFLALIGTTLSCMNTGARVTYAMGRDEEVPEHFGLLHGENLTPHRAIWTLAVISAVLGAYAALFYFAGALRPTTRRSRRCHTTSGTRSA